MSIQVPRLKPGQVFLTRTDLLKMSAYLQQLAKMTPTQHPGEFTENAVVVVDVEVYLGGGVWMFIPSEFEITSPEVVFSNESEDHHIKLVFSSDLVITDLEIPAHGTATLKVEHGKDEANTIDLYAQKVGEGNNWFKVPSGSGNGADMKINNP